ncbi:MAG: hypothetical protein JXB07_18830 [Anaerolineae bacterium]|nr:hypothetical protein [Anaerolineae bacterium]
MEFLQFLTAILELVPVVAAAGLLVAAATNLIKLINKLRSGTIEDGTAGLISLIINAAAWAFLWFAGPRLGEAEAINLLTESGQIATLIVILLTSLLTSKVGHLVFGWLGLAVHLSAPEGINYSITSDYTPSIQQILDDMEVDTNLRAA